MDLITSLHDPNLTNTPQYSSLDQKELINVYKYSWVDSGLGYGNWKRLRFINEKMYGQHSNENQRPRSE